MKVFIYLCAAVAAVAASAATNSWLKQDRTVALPGVAGRLDHLAVDLTGHRLFVAALENNTVEVVDFQAGKHLLTIDEIKEPQGLLYLPKPNILFVASGGDGQLKMFECDSFRPVKTIGRLPDADNLRYDAFSGRVYVGYGKGALGLVNALSGVHTLSIELGSHPEGFALEEHGSRIFINLPRSGAIAVVNRMARSVEQTWPLSKASENFPLALDEANQRLFVGCRKPPRLLVLDTASGKVVSEPEISGDTDDLFLDQKRARIYAICGEGSVDVLQQREKDQWAGAGKVRTAPGARTGLFVPELDFLCVAVPKRPGQQCEVRFFKCN
jgi:DNA-binding beta-propeller fold protein YncE